LRSNWLDATPGSPVVASYGYPAVFVGTLLEGETNLRVGDHSQSRESQIE